MSIELYSWPKSSGTRVSWALEELGVSYNYHELDPQKQEYQSPEYLAVNPHGKVPALIDDKQFLFESAAILLHLGDKYGIEANLWPATRDPKHIDALCWTIWSTTELRANMMQYVYHGMSTPVSFAPEQRSKAAAEYYYAQLKQNLDALETRLQNNEYILGDFSLVDVATAMIVLMGSSMGLPLDEFPRIVNWCQRCRERPAFSKAR